MWGILPPDIYIFEENEQYRFDGFPLLADYLQGFFWFIFRRIQASNLVSLFSLSAYILFLKSVFKVSWYLSIIALLTIPLVQFHMTSCYVDLPANLAFSVGFIFYHGNVCCCLYYAPVP